MLQYKAYAYDAENRLMTGGGATYTYDGDGNRVAKAGTASELYWLGATGEILAESDASGNITNQYVFFGGKRVARLDSAGVHYYISDHLGSATVIANASGEIEREDRYFPYGGERWTAGSDPNHYKFTGKERDSETGLDYFGARYYGSNMGRFMSPDPLLNSGQPWNPQTWNRLVAQVSPYFRCPTFASPFLGANVGKHTLEDFWIFTVGERKSVPDSPPPVLRGRRPFIPIPDFVKIDSHFGNRRSPVTLFL